ncbi:NAD(P)H-hydrate dehydratase [Deminuibacter soli]|uniref:Bifunctional NAD(P)H-hydrate repair enzyme n=1 Tax=Deminuibacter soli TaxID=2291815 RepID=A0A3E1NK65_9BACT|nr:NAD(P)H-hydrate dehydratase [Deminuibacter soli]
MKLFSASQIQRWDAYTIAHEPITSLELMERASGACADWIMANCKQLDTARIHIFCGKGNNGGDGLAIARMLTAAGLQPIVYILEFGAKGTADFQANLQQLHTVTHTIHFIQDETHLPVISGNDWVIDALFGSGLNRPLQNLSQTLVTHINNAKAKVIAIDVPSGMYVDASAAGNTIIQARYTLTFQTIKRCFLAAENGAYAGDVHVLPIGLLPAYAAEEPSDWEQVTLPLMQSFYKPRQRFAHKGTYGHALLVTGNKGKMGASLMAARACLRSGVGLLTVSTPEWGYPVLQTAVPEAMTIPRDSTAKEDLSKYTIGAGPGIGTEKDTLALLEQLLQHAQKPLVLDADALNLISENQQLLQYIPAGSIISPHPKEFERLFGKQPDDFARMQRAIDASREHSIVIILKGHYTLTAFAGRGYFNATGNPGMATGGSGDVLTGILTALLAQQYEPLQAALLGVYIHGLAADLALKNQSMESLLPGDIIEHLGQAFKKLQKI